MGCSECKGARGDEALNEENEPALLSQSDPQICVVEPSPAAKSTTTPADNKEANFDRQVSKESTNPAKYGPWTNTLAHELQDAVDRIFAKEERLAKCGFSLTIADPMLDGCPLIGCSVGFHTLCGYEMHEIVGRNCRFLIDPMPPHMIDQKMRDRTREFCENVKLGKHHDVVYQPFEPWMPSGAAGELFCFQMNARKDGSHFRNMFYLIAVELDDQPYILGLQTELRQEAEFQEACGLACTVLRSNSLELDKMLSSKFWYSAPLRRQDMAYDESMIN